MTRTIKETTLDEVRVLQQNGLVQEKDINLLTLNLYSNIITNVAFGGNLTSRKVQFENDDGSLGELGITDALEKVI